MLRVKEVAARLHISKQTALELVTAHGIALPGRGRRRFIRLISEQALADYLREHSAR